MGYIQISLAGFTRRNGIKMKRRRDERRRRGNSEGQVWDRDRRGIYKSKGRQ
jgi:hypothetical protein